MVKRASGYGLSFLLVLIAGLTGGVAGLLLFQPPDLSQVTLPDAEGGLYLVSTVVALAAPGTSDRERPPQLSMRSPTPRYEGPALTPTAAAVVAIPTPIPPTATPSPAPTEAAIPAPNVPAEATVPSEPTPSPTPTATTPALEGEYEFVPAGPVRHTVDGCAGQAILGTVYDPAGNPIAGVRLWMYDQWANTAYAQSKSGTTDLGRYDFPLFYSGPVVLYVSVLGPDGSPVSPTVEIYHRQGPQQAANCHWVDWKRTH